MPVSILFQKQCPVSPDLWPRILLLFVCLSVCFVLIKLIGTQELPLGLCLGITHGGFWGCSRSNQDGSHHKEDSYPLYYHSVPITLLFDSEFDFVSGLKQAVQWTGCFPRMKLSLVCSHEPPIFPSPLRFSLSKEQEYGHEQSRVLP